MIRYARWDLGAVELIDPQTRIPLSPLYPLDKAANAEGRRRTLASHTDQNPQSTPESGSADELPPLLRKCLAEYAATSRPPAYLPHRSSKKTP